MTDSASSPPAAPAPAPQSEPGAAPSAQLPGTESPDTAAAAPTQASDEPAQASAEPAQASADDAKAPARPGRSPQACGARLAELFPALFSGPARPIQLRIQAAIQLRAPGEFSKGELSAFLRRHTGATRYLLALTQATQRLDLDGQPAGEISEEHRLAASEELARRRALHAERRRAEAAGGRARAPQASAEPATAQPAEGPPPRGPRRERQPGATPRDGGGQKPGQGRAAERPRERRGDRPQDRPQDRQNDRTHDRPHNRPPMRPQGLAQGRPFDRSAAQQAPRQPAVAEDRLPADPERRERALLLRAYNGTTLTRENFCALKGITTDYLETQLALARQEAGAQPGRSAAPERRPGRPR